jgi:nitrogen regulatory protein PII
MAGEIRIYYEGHALLKSGFEAFFKELRTRATEKRWRFRLIASGSGATACRDFDIALRANRDAWNILLIDSEGPLDANSSASLCQKSAFAIGGAGLSRSATWRTGNHSLTVAALHEAAFRAMTVREWLGQGHWRVTDQKGDYYDNETTHGPKLLASIDADMVQKAAPNCQRLFRTVLAGLA